MAIPINKNYDIVLGDSKTWAIHEYTSDTRASNQDISGNEYKLTIKRKRTDTQDNAILAVTTTVGASPAGVGGTASIGITAVQSNTNLVIGVVYFYDLQRTKSDASVDTLMIGTIQVKHDITT